MIGNSLFFIRESLENLFDKLDGYKQAFTLLLQLMKTYLTICCCVGCQAKPTKDPGKGVQDLESRLSESVPKCVGALLSSVAGIILGCARFLNVCGGVFKLLPAQTTTSVLDPPQRRSCFPELLSASFPSMFVAA